ncbi:MAG TPA: hypothetical protein VH643_00525 [Gemmataceae bacterium]|jgi:hypothetical protein
MNVSRLRLSLFLVLPLLALGCAGSGLPRDKAEETEATIKSNLAKLDPADRESAEDQKFCAVQTENRLGIMGKPIKVTIKDEPVFLCCKGCEKTAKQDPDKTLARAEELRIRTALAQLDPADRKLAEEQKYCATDPERQPENRLGMMGKPIKIMLKGQPVFLCCAGCKKTAREDPDKTLEDVKKIKAANAAAKEKDHD